jgi:hypothetical protein
VARELKWKLEGYDAFSGDPYPLGTILVEGGGTLDGLKPECRTYGEAWADALKALALLERTQPSASSGGQSGIQDRVYIVHPDGRRERFWG